MSEPKGSDICSACGERADEHGDFGFRDHAFRDASGEAWDIDWSHRRESKPEPSLPLSAIRALIQQMREFQADTWHSPTEMGAAQRRATKHWADKLETLCPDDGTT